MIASSKELQITVREITEVELPALLRLYMHLNPGDEVLPPDEAAQIWKLMAQTSRCVYGAHSGSGLVAACTLLAIPNLTWGGRPYALIENVGFQRGVKTGFVARPGG